VSVTINVGPAVATAVDLAELVPEHLAPRVIVELTEHAAIDDYPRLIEALAPARRRGIRLAIDDTGSGYSSLAHILKLAPEFIKLDCEITRGIDLDPVRRALASSLVTFAAETGAEIIAEGVETADELDVLRSLGIDHAQGYHLGPPAPLAACLRATHRQLR
jgi:EAL domain-containing protein (putative c-di-GMP-specific phosphodiesterase class I)